MTAAHLTIAVFDRSTGWTLPESQVDRLTEAAGAAMPVQRLTGFAELDGALESTSCLIGMPLNADQMRKHASHLKWVQLTGSDGSATSAVREALRSGVRVSGTAPFRAPQVAEQSLGLALTLLRGIDRSMRAQSEHRWGTNDIADRMRELNGSRVVVVGCGEIAREIVRRLKAFSAHATVIGRTGDPETEGADAFHDLSEIDAVLPRTDVLIVAAPRVRATDGLIDRKRFDRMKPSSILVDVSRSRIVDERAMIDALRKGRISAAGLDVFESEPLPASSPLWTMPNVIITPHVAAASPTYWTRAVDVICENIRRYGAQEPLLDELGSRWYDAAAARG